MTAAVLYVHPHGHLNDLVVPAGALSCMNALTAPRLGRYAFELRDDELRAARVVAIDVHWALALPGFERLVAHVERVNPDAMVVVGGITAGHFARELLRNQAVDYVVRGDSEVAFRALVEALLDGRSGDGIPNVCSRTGTGPRRRMTQAEFDATDCVTADWFPTYAKASDWDAAAFPAGRTIPVARGCPRRCPTCYGSFASVFGGGYLLRSPESLARELERAASLRVRNLRLIFGKPPARALGALLSRVADSGPYRFATTVGLYLCTPPSRSDLDAIERTFDAPVAISMVPPDEHVPSPTIAALAQEHDAWRAVAARAAGSSRLSLDVWATTDRELGAVREMLGHGDSPRVTVSLGAVWSMTRPTDEGRASYDEVRAAVEPTWTFYAARLLSPALARMLAPFRHLDELDGDPERVAPPPAPLDEPFRVIHSSFRRHRLPTLPGLAFSVFPVRLRGAPTRAHGGVVHSGALGFAPPEAITSLDLEAGAAFATGVDAFGVELVARHELSTAAGALAFVPHRPDDPDGVERTWAEALARDGLTVIRVPASGPPASVRVGLRMQELTVAVVDPSATVLARGKAEIERYRTPPPGGT